MAGGLPPIKIIYDEKVIISLSPWTVFFFVIDVLEFLGVIPDPIDLILQQFAGRPRELDTINMSGWLQNSVHPGARLWGVQLLRTLQDFDIVTSSSDAGD